MSATLFELKKILADIREKTGIEVRLSPRGEGETGFALDYCGNFVDAYLDGEGEGVERDIRLLQYLVANADVRRLFPEREEALKNILLGEGGGWYAYRYMTKYRLPELSCFAIDLRAEKMTHEALTHVESCVADSRDVALVMDENRIAIVKFSEKGQTPVEFAQFLAQSLYEELGIKVSVGVGSEVKSFAEIALSYRQAATALRMSSIFRAKGEVHSYREYLLVRVLEDVPKDRLKEYFSQLQSEECAELFEDAELLNTAEEFLENSLNISETSRNLYMHRNTLMYRLDKIERLSGLNIRNFSDAVTFRVMAILYKLLHL